MHRISLMKTLAVMDTVNDSLRKLIDSIVFYLENIEPWAASLVLFAVAILTLVGLFVMIKKFIKTFIILAVLAGAFYLIKEYTNILDNILKIFI
ncbi:MAG: hypothetical protein AB7E09_02765 [Candidatus Izemoplasmatales bacterium]|uniref:Uncharacterized protein n=1 Tax=Hujiaoplasma nucleasis TaxID=2725268 RepID=A0A7L6N7B3_9MOLU|nr:hypothetical protein [Hujiaoplasma nucleasis]QLY40424.1 hypothetical protein HF295_06010 [Hujiaoplasma nucleasis]